MARSTNTRLFFYRLQNDSRKKNSRSSKSSRYVFFKNLLFSAIFNDNFSSTVWFFKVFTHDFLINYALDRNSEGALCSSTFNWLHCEKISAQNSNVYVQENFFLTFEKSKFRAP